MFLRPHDVKLVSILEGWNMETLLWRGCISDANALHDPTSVLLFLTP